GGTLLAPPAPSLHHLAIVPEMLRLKTQIPADVLPNRRPRRQLDWKRVLPVEALGLRRAFRGPERQLIRRLRRLDLGPKPWKIERIAGGITHHNFVVRAC